MTKIAVIIGSVREGRSSDKLANWVAKEFTGKADVEVVDLRDYPLPFFEEAVPPRYNPGREAKPEVQKWLDKVGEFDGYVLVTPEYNRSTSAVLKNALETLDFQMDHKPVALVAHGSTGGAQAVANLRLTIPGNNAVTIPSALYFTDRVGEAIDDEGMLSAELVDNPYGPQAALTGLAADLLKYAEAFKTVRG
jgi:NAD(P)H-dependent FMN reductase